MSLDYNEKNIQLARNLRKNSTPQEKHLWYDYLSKYPIRFQRQKAIDNFIADFYCHKAKLVIELDGSQHFESDNINKDDKRTQYFKSLGISVLRIPNNQVNQNFAGVCEYIDDVITKSLSLLLRKIQLP